MSASHKFHKTYTIGTQTVSKKNPLEHLLDFGEEPATEAPASGTPSQRLQQILKKIDEISTRIDRLTDDE